MQKNKNGIYESPMMDVIRIEDRNIITDSNGTENDWLDTMAF